MFYFSHEKPLWWKEVNTHTHTHPAINHTPIDFGWELDKNNEYLLVKWFEGDHVPPQLELTDTDIYIEESEDEIDWDSDNDNELSSDDENESL